MAHILALHPPMVRRFVPLGLLLLIAAPVGAQPVNATRLRGEAEAVRTRKRLTEAQQKLNDGKPAEAADDLQKILDESGDDLVLVRDDNFQPARRLVQQYLAALPAPTLAAFRNRIDTPAKQLLDAGRAKRDPAPLRELIARYFVSRPAEDALLLLGELEFERGDFAAAERHWRRLLPDAATDELKYPEPKTDPAAVRARVILAQAFRGDLARAQEELARLRTDHPKASGPLAGTTGVYADTLAKLVAAPPRVPSDAAGWTGFAGNASRDGKPDAPLPRYWPSRPTWKTPIPRDPATKGDRVSPAAVNRVSTLAFHPVVLNGLAYLADAGRVIQFDLRTGASRVAFRYTDLPERPDIDPDDLAVPCDLDADYTLTVANGRVYARIGPPALPTGLEPRPPQTYLVALEPQNPQFVGPNERTLVSRWQVAPPVAAGVFAAWEGAPLVANGRVYAAFLRVDGNRFVQAVACYPEGGAKPLWVADVCDADANRTTGGRSRHAVLTRAGPNVVFASHTGVTVAVTMATGKPAWAFRNPPVDRPPLTSPRDLCPPVYSDGKVFIAPADGDAVYALDAESGRPLWASARGIQAAHLLGVSDGKLIVTVHSPVKGVRGFDVNTGQDSGTAGWQQHDDPFLGTYGRGLAGPNLILWPTQKWLWILNPADGRVASVPNPNVAGPLGNLAYADGVVLVATATDVHGYVFDDTVPAPPPSAVPSVIIAAADPPRFDTRPVVPAAGTAFDAVAAASLTAPARTREASLPPGAVPLRPLGRPSDTRLAVCDGRAVFAVDLSDGRPLWRMPLDPPAALTHAGFAANGRLFAVGPHAVVAVDAAGRKRWEFRVPPFLPTPELSAATFVGTRLVMRLGERCLIALDTTTGAVAWVRDAFGRPWYGGEGIASAPRFGPFLGATDRAVIAQRGDRWWLVSADTGKVEGDEPSSLTDWACPPLSAGGNRAILPDQFGAVVGWEGARPAWRFDPARPASWTGTPPAFRRFDGDLLVAVSRNYGCEVHRLLADRNVGLWSGPRLLPAGSLDLSAADADPDRFYLPAANALFAVDRRTGRVDWRADLPPLPDGLGWRVRAGRRTVIAVPESALPTESLGAAIDRTPDQVASLPTPIRLAGVLVSLFAAGTSHTLPVLLFDPEDGGRLVQRIDLPAVGPPAVVCLHAETAAVATTGRLVWLGGK